MKTGGVKWRETHHFKWLIIFTYATEGLLISGNLISYLILLSIPPRYQNRTETQTRGPITKGFALCGPRPDQNLQAVSEQLSGGTWIRQKDGSHQQHKTLGPIWTGTISKASTVSGHQHTFGGQTPLHIFCLSWWMETWVVFPHYSRAHSFTVSPSHTGPLSWRNYLL